MKQPTKTSLKKKLWKIVSEYIRRRDANRDGFAECVTCGTIKQWKELQAGHFIQGRRNSTIYEETNIHAQCLTEDSSIKMFNGQSKSIKKIKTGDRIWAFNEKTFQLEFATVENKHSFVPDELYEIEMEDGKRFYATKDHMIVSNKKWVEIRNMLHDVSTHDILEL